MDDRRWLLSYGFLSEVGETGSPCTGELDFRVRIRKGDVIGILLLLGPSCTSSPAVYSDCPK